jgi:hypothetical protein
MKSLLASLILSVVAIAAYGDNSQPEVKVLLAANNLTHLEALKYNGDVQCGIIEDVSLNLKVSDTHWVHWFSLTGCDGGNHYEEYIMLLSERNGNWSNDAVIQIGGGYRFTLTELQLHLPDNTILLQGLTWDNGDPHCCPSVKHTNVLHITPDNKLKF